LVTAAFAAQGQTLEVPMQLVDAKGGGQSIGIITVTQTAEGVVFTPKLDGLPPGLHGFHMHEKPSCDPAMDPGKGQLAAAGPKVVTRSRQDRPSRRSDGAGHLGDLPALKVDRNGKATTPVVAPRLRL
jgi:Cu-Zn family superoxide dismutase